MTSGAKVGLPSFAARAVFLRPVNEADIHQRVRALAASRSQRSGVKRKERPFYTTRLSRPPSLISVWPPEDPAPDPSSVGVKRRLTPVSRIPDTVIEATGLAVARDNRSTVFARCDTRTTTLHRSQKNPGQWRSQTVHCIGTGLKHETLRAGAFGLRRGAMTVDLNRPHNRRQESPGLSADSLATRGSPAKPAEQGPRIREGQTGHGSWPRRGG